jgi:hypothetical protein
LFSFSKSIILFFLLFKTSRASLSNDGAITTSQKSLFISSALLKSIVLLEINTPPKAETGSPARASL